MKAKVLFLSFCYIFVILFFCRSLRREDHQTFTDREYDVHTSSPNSG